MAKDLFSEQAQVYAAYRPGYPKELIEYILQFVKEKNCAWDCATGNGQAARLLAEYFEKVEATDISQGQLDKAFHQHNIHYTLSPAEKTPFPDHYFDLITVAQAYHWLDWKGFHQEVMRVAKPGCVVAIWGYVLLQCKDQKIQDLVLHFYKDITGPYWDPARKFLDEKYQSVQFDFEPLPGRDFSTQVQWKREQLEGFLESWSAVQAYTRLHGTSPVNLIRDELYKIWNKDDIKEISFPVFLRLGRV